MWMRRNSTVSQAWGGHRTLGQRIGGRNKSGVGDAYLHSVGLTRLAAVGGMARAEPSHRDFAPRAGCQIMDCSQGKDTQWRP